ncbi:MAG TPA: hypothetical protein VJH03_15315 [Blastocatellia bacterium]|nr:hypothetical protein [Blastocatellia bacterium]
MRNQNQTRTPLRIAAVFVVLAVPFSLSLFETRASFEDRLTAVGDAWTQISDLLAGNYASSAITRVLPLEQSDSTPIEGDAIPVDMSAAPSDQASTSSTPGVVACLVEREHRSTSLKSNLTARGRSELDAGRADSVRRTVSAQVLIKIDPAALRVQPERLQRELAKLHVNLSNAARIWRGIVPPNVTVELRPLRVQVPHPPKVCGSASGSRANADEAGQRTLRTIIVERLASDMDGSDRDADKGSPAVRSTSGFEPDVIP